MSDRSPGGLARVRWGFVTAAAVALHGVLTRCLWKPLHADGLGQPVTGFLNGLDHLLHLPGSCAAETLGAGNWFHAGGRFWLIALALNAPFAFLLGWLLPSLWRRQPAAQAARRRFLRAGLRLAAGGTAAGLGYSLLVEPRWFRVTHRRFPVRGLPPELDGLRLVQLTDIHHGPWLARPYVREVIDAANDLRPDLVLLTGDYVHQSPAYFGPVIEELARLRPRVGTVAVLGNHDWWEGAERARREFAAAGIPLIDNGRRVLTPDRQLVDGADRGLALCGVDDLLQGKPDYARALRGLPGEMPRLLLSHNPDVAEERAFLRGGWRVDLMIGGHTHGGQIFVPGLGTPIVPSRYGQKYARGLVRGPACPVLVCRGIGMVVLPLRLGVPPEIAVLELTAGG
jgi:hypothetical protein